jgi:hypothetical protein
MKQINKDIQYVAFGKLEFETEERCKRRAFAYSHVLCALNDVGSGADENLSKIREIISSIRAICLNETGYLIETYDTELNGSEWSGWKKNPYTKHKGE